MNIFTNCDVREALKVFAPWVAIGVSIVALWVQIRRSRFAQGVDLILKLEGRFFESGDMINARKNAAQALKNNPSSPSSEIEDVLDFFETLGLLVRKKALDKEMVWHTFYHWLQRYWILSEKYILEKQRTKPAIWEDLVALHKYLVAMELKKSKSRDDVDIADNELRQFLDEEIDL